MNADKYYTSKITRIKAETSESITIFLNIPKENNEYFSYKAGQYVDIKMIIDGNELIRPYSLSSSPIADSTIAITFKKTKDISATNYLIDNLKLGDEIIFSEAKGKFIVEPNKDKSDIYVFFAAGSGITPIFSQIKTLLAVEENSALFLFYGNKDLERAIFHKELNDLERKKIANLKRIDILTEPKEDWKCDRGRITKEKAIALLNLHIGVFIQDAKYYVCGPQGMNDSVIEALKELRVPNESIFTE